MIGALGKLVVPSPGTRVLLSTLLPASTKGHQALHGIMFQALASNTGNVYIGNKSLVKSTLVGCYAVLAIPTVNFLPTFSAALTIAPNGLDSIENFSIDADVASNGVLITYLVN
jgi:hypothetical protein